MPLVGIARTIVEERLRTAAPGPLFTDEKGAALTSNDVASFLVRNRERSPLDHFVTHDLRRTVATGLVDLSICFETVTAVHGREVTGQSERVLTRHYPRSDVVARKTEALESWDRRLREIAQGTSADKVTPIGAVRVVAIVSKPAVNWNIRLA